MRSIICLLFVIGISCSGQKKASTDKEDVVFTDSTKVQLVLQESYSNVQNEIFQVITGEKALKKVFLQINKTRKPGIPIPQIDFAKESLLLYCAGITSGSRNLELVVMEESQDSIKIGVKDTIKSTKIDLSTTTTPFCLYAIPLTRKKIIFLGEKEQ